MFKRIRLPVSIQEVVLNLNNEAMQRLIVGVGDHLQDGPANEFSSQESVNHYWLIQVWLHIKDHRASIV